MKYSSKIFGIFVAASIGNGLAGRHHGGGWTSSSSDSSSSSDDGHHGGGGGDYPSDDDLNVRFNKFAVLEGGEETAARLLPLDKWDYPVGRKYKVERFLKEETNAVSVVNDWYDYEIMYSVAGLIHDVGGEPDHPQSKSTAAYWGQLKEVVEMRELDKDAAGSTALAEKMLLPLRWIDYTVDDVSEAVHDEYPGLHQAEFLEDLVGRGLYGPTEFDNSALARRSGGRFLRGIISLSDLHTWSVGVVAPHNFAAKWYAGRARPEEVAFKISEGGTEGIKREYVPEEIWQSISDMNLEKATDFARYPEGSPRHPSWPAMHSAASNISFWLQAVMNLTPSQLCEAKKVDYAVAYARTVAGVHFPGDNIAGLNMGQIVVAEAIAEHLSEKYDSDKWYIKNKIDNLRFDWKDYDPLEDCSALESSS